MSALAFIVVSVLHFIAFALSVVAKRRMSKVTENIDGFEKLYYAYSSDILSGMALGATTFIMAGPLIIKIGSKCLCLGRGLRPGASRGCAIILFIICWIAFLFAEVLLLAGLELSCETLKKGVFGAAAAFILFTGLLVEFYYVSYSRANARPYYSGDNDVRMSTM